MPKYTANHFYNRASGLGSLAFPIFFLKKQSFSQAGYPLSDNPQVAFFDKDDFAFPNYPVPMIAST